jgi:hypothetical protein
LEPWKEAIRILMLYHAKDQKSKLGQISTAFIPSTDYGESCKDTLFKQAISCVKWVKTEWVKIQSESI